MGKYIHNFKESTQFQIAYYGDGSDGTIVPTKGIILSGVTYLYEGSESFGEGEFTAYIWKSSEDKMVTQYRNLFHATGFGDFGYGYAYKYDEFINSITGETQSEPNRYSIEGIVEDTDQMYKKPWVSLTKEDNGIVSVIDEDNNEYTYIKDTIYYGE